VTAPTSITVQSTEFSAGEPIPMRYTCDGENISPPLSWAGIPPNSGALALVVDDPDAPRGTYTHWVVVNINPAITSLGIGEVAAGARLVVNSAGDAAYTGPCPPSGTHHYRFTVYALSHPLEPDRTRSLKDALAAIRAAATARGQLVGTYHR
jgi:Raf kinase inhibitor-like YbhB/YbcL family protein